MQPAELDEEMCRGDNDTGQAVRVLRRVSSRLGGCPMPEESVEAARQLAEEVSPDPEHAFQVCRVALMLFDATRELHGLPGRARWLLEMGALLHDIGQSVDYSGHHKHSRDLILRTALPGCTEEERAMIACLARYHRKAMPSEKHGLFAGLSAEKQGWVRCLAGLLRVADGLDRTHSASVDSLGVHWAHERLHIVVRQEADSPADLWGGQRKGDLLAEVLGMEVDVTGEGGRT